MTTTASELLNMYLLISGTTIIYDLICSVRFEFYVDRIIYILKYTYFKLESPFYAIKRKLWIKLFKNDRLSLEQKWNNECGKRARINFRFSPEDVIINPIELSFSACFNYSRTQTHIHMNNPRRFLNWKRIDLDPLNGFILNIGHPLSN